MKVRFSVVMLILILTGTIIGVVFVHTHNNLLNQFQKTKDKDEINTVMIENNEMPQSEKKITDDVTTETQDFNNEDENKQLDSNKNQDDTKELEMRLSSETRETHDEEADDTEEKDFIPVETYSNENKSVLDDLGNEDELYDLIVIPESSSNSSNNNELPDVPFP